METARQHNNFRFLPAVVAFAFLVAVLLPGGPAAVAQGQAGSSGSAAKIENGKKIFAAQKCDGCHGAEAQGGTGPLGGPRLAALGIPLSEFIDYVRKPDNPMPAFSARQISDADLSDLYAYLKSLAGPAAPVLPASASAENGKKLFTSAGCYECHGREGQGGSAGPRLAPNPISFAAFVSQCRKPAEQMPPYTSKVLSDAQLADIYTFLQSIPKPPDPSTISILQ